MTHPGSGERPGPFDYNRAAKKDRPVEAGSGWPQSLRVAYWILVVAAVVMLTSGLVAFFGGTQPQPGSDNELVEFLRTNRTFVAGANIVGAIIIALVAPQLSTGSTWARIILCVVIGLTCFFNVAAVAVGVGGLVLVAIPILLLAATYAMFRPAANTFIRETSWRS